MKDQEQRLTLAIQKKGRLYEDSIDLLTRCGLKLNSLQSDSLVCRSENLPIDILLIRDDDIPVFVMDEVCDFGIVGENILYEKQDDLILEKKKCFDIVRRLGFARCRLMLAIPEAFNYSSPASFNHQRIATSYPNLLKKYLDEREIQAEIITISGSVEIAPNLHMADAICDLVSSGRTLEANKLKSVETVLKSQAVLIKTDCALSPEKQAIASLLLRRIEGVLMAQECKYILFHAPKSALSEIQYIFPGCESPTILPLQSTTQKVAVHVVSGEAVFWDTLEELKKIGASSILVLPIEKMME